LHPQRNLTSASKIAWSPQELKYIGKSIKYLTTQNGGTKPKNLCALIKEKILQDENAHSIFHSHHTLDSSRIRWGVQSFITKEKERKEKHWIGEKEGE